MIEVPLFIKTDEGRLRLAADTMDRAAIQFRMIADAIRSGTVEPDIIDKWADEITIARHSVFPE